jgi:hypothetical protein
MQGNRKTVRFASLAVVLTAAAAFSACDVVVTSMDAKGKAEDQWTRTYPMAAGEVQIVNVNGSIDVVGGGGNQVEVVAERTARGTTDEDAKKILSQASIGEDVSASLIRLETKPPTGQGRRLDVKYHVKVPASVSVRLETQNGSIEVVAVKGTVRVEVSNGSVKGRDLAGSVDARTTNGAVKLDLLAVATGGVRAATVNGGVDLTLPSEAKADVEARCVNGGIGIDGLKLDGPERTRRSVEGRLNGGGPKVVAETTNGGIKITGK